MATAAGSLSESQNGSASTTNNYYNAKMSRSDVPAGDVLEMRRKRFSRMVSDGRLGLGIDERRPDSPFEPPRLQRTVSSSGFPIQRNLSSNGLPTLQRTISSAALQPKNEVLKTTFGGKKNGNNNMVLQLVLPSNPDPYMTTSSIDEILGGTNNTRRKTSIGSQQDAYSTAGTESYVNPGYINDLGDFSRNYPLEPPHTPISTVSTSEHAKPSTLEHKKQNFRKHLANILSSMYALFIVTLGLVVYISDVVLDNSPIAETFSLYLVIVAFIFVLYIIVDIKLFVNKKNRYIDLLEKNVPQEIELKETANGEFQLNITLPEAARIAKQLEHRYCFSKDRHSANFYLKIGAAVFCLGHLIHSGLLIGYQIMFLTSDGDAFYECASVASLILDFIYPIYSFFLLYFIFKYSNIITNRHMAVVRFGFMHCIAASVCFWLWTILRETMESLAHHDQHSLDVDDAATKAYEERRQEAVALPLTSYAKRGAKLLTSYLNISTHQFIGECQSDEGLNLIYRDYSPYLYPFSVEYSILVVGVLFVIWQNVGKCKEQEEMSPNRQCESPVGNGDNLESNIVIHADCHSANKGLFGGIVVMVLTVVSIILFLIAVNDNRYQTEAVIINVLTSIVIVLMMLIACVFAFRQTSKLDFGSGHVSILDDLLLYLCIPAYFLNGITSIIPSIINGHATGIMSVIVEIAQIIVQTLFIMDGLRRCSNSKELRKQKSGRELVTFLIVCNVAMWIMQTFQVKSHGLIDSKYDFYGEELWTIVGHACVPLMMFYRFHSSVCLVDIWKYAYEAESH